MRAFTLMIGLIGLPVAAAAQAADSVALPDSTYLALTLELPVSGTFQVSGTRERPRQQPMRIYQLFRIDRVEVVGCDLMWLERRGDPGVIMDPRRATRVTVPLKDIDVEELEARQSFSSGLRLDPPAWEIWGRAIDRSKRPFVSKPEDSAIKRSDNKFTITVVDRDAAFRFKALLIDAIQRCDSWRTAPLRPRG